VKGIHTEGTYLHRKHGTENDVHTTHNVSATKPGRTRWAEHVAHVIKLRNVYTISARTFIKRETNMQIEMPKRGCTMELFSCLRCFILAL
jgi:hypothetical protein